VRSKHLASFLFFRLWHGFGSAALSTQAGTLIHEASHALADTGDYIKDGKILKGSNPEETDKTGCKTPFLYFFMRLVLNTNFRREQDKPVQNG